MIQFYFYFDTISNASINKDSIVQDLVGKSIIIINTVVEKFEENLFSVKVYTEADQVSDLQNFFKNKYGTSYDGWGQEVNL